MDRIERAIHNIISESQGKVVLISFSGMMKDSGMLVIKKRLDMQRVYKFKVKGDIITIKNKSEQVVFEKLISSYQEPFSFSLNN